MRVCTFAMLLPTHVTGGMEIHAIELAKGLVKAGNDVVVITSRHPQGVEKESINGVEIYYTDVDASSKKPLGRKSLKKFEELNAQKKFDVIHSQSFAAFYYVNDGLKKRLGIPLVTTIHGTSYSEIRSNLNQGFNLMLIPKIIFQLYTHHFQTKWIVRASDAIIAISKELTDKIPKDYKISPKKVKTVYNGIDTDTFKPSDSLVKEKFKGKKIILSVSVLHRQKGVQKLLMAFQKVRSEIPETHLLIVGDGPYRKDLEELTKSLGLSEHVTFAGKKPNKELRDYYNACAVFVIPTIRVEGLPLIVLESMACAKPVVASDIGGIPSVITDGVNGILVRPGDVDKLAEKTVWVLKNDVDARKIAANARKTIEDKFSRQKMVADTIKIFKEVIS